MRISGRSDYTYQHKNARFLRDSMKMSAPCFANLFELDFIRSQPNEMSRRWFDAVSFDVSK